MRSTEFQLAQFNVAKMLFPLDSPRMAGFTERLKQVNALAEAAPGFVWRLEHSESTDRFLLNVSVWETVESLEEFTFSGLHGEAVELRRQWFDRPDQPSVVLWWVPKGHRPDLPEAQERLARLRGMGPTLDAFTFRTARQFPSPLGLTA